MTTSSPAPSSSSSQLACGADTSADVPDFWIGVGASLIGSIILNLGLNIQKYAFARIARRKPHERWPFYKDPFWLFGFLVFIVGNFGDAVGLTFTPQSVITPIGSISLVSNLFFARCLLGEQIGFRTLFAVVLIVGGVVCIVSASDSSCSEETIDTLIEKWDQPRFIIFATLHLLLLVVTLFYSSKLERRMQGELKNISKEEQLRLRIMFPMLGSLFASWTVLLSKSVGELVKQSFRGANQMGHWQSYMMIAGFLISCPCQIIFLNKGIAYFEALYIVPFFYSVWCISSITMGALYFSEFDSFVTWQIAVFALGVCMTIGGVVVLQSRAIDDGPSLPPTIMLTRRSIVWEPSTRPVSHSITL